MKTAIAKINKSGIENYLDHIRKTAPILEDLYNRYQK
jgi:hypothetical protein